MILKGSCQPPLQSIDNKWELTPCSLKVALNQKGLRLNTEYILYKLVLFESSPESEGIKTFALARSLLPSLV